MLLLWGNTDMVIWKLYFPPHILANTETMLNSDPPFKYSCILDMHNNHGCVATMVVV